MNTNLLSADFAEVLENFNFKKVKKVMKFLNWKWSEYNRTPTIKEMKNNCSRLFEESLGTYESTKHSITTSSGGFEVSVYKNSVSVKFIVTEYYWESEE